MTTLASLRARVEGLTGPDREVDCLIWAEFDGRDVRYEDNKLLARRRKPPHDECWLGSIDPGRVRRNFSTTTGTKPPIPNLTASIDASLALVERVLPGSTWSISGRNDFDAEITAGSAHGVYDYAPTAPLAIILATLSAMEKEQS